MTRIFAVLTGLLLVGFTMTLALAGETIITWSPPTERTDDTPLADSELRYYSIYCAPYPPPLWFQVAVPFTVDLYEANKADLGWYCEQYWCGLTVTDTADEESGYSNIVAVPGLCP